MDKNKLAGHLMALFCTMVWGVTFVISKRLMTWYTPVQLMFMRFAAAYAVLWALYPHWERIIWKEELRYFCMGLFGCTLYFFAENTALQLTYAANVSTIVAAAPIVTAILAHYFTGGRERLTKWTWIGFGLAMLGVVLVVFNGAFVLHLSPKGDILAFFTAVVWSIYSVLQSNILGKHSSLFITRKVMLYGLITALPFFLTSGLDTFSLAPLWAEWQNLGGFLFLAVLGSAACYFLWATAQKKIGLVNTSNYIYAIPFVTMVAGVLYLDEPLSLVGILGAMLIIAGVWAAGRKTGEDR